MGVLQSIDPSVIIPVKTQEQIEDEVRSEVDANLGKEEDLEQHARERPKSADSFREEIAPDPFAATTPEKAKAPAEDELTPEPATLKRKKSSVKKKDSALLPELEQEAVRNASGEDPMQQENKPYRQRSSMRPTPPPDHSATANMARQLLRAPGGFQANMRRMTFQQQMVVLEEMRRDREEKLQKIREKEAKRQAAKKAMVEAEKAEKAVIAAEKEEMQEIDKELQAAQRSEMAVWRRKKAAESRQKAAEEEAMVAQAKAEAAAKAKAREEADKAFKEEKQRRLKAHKKRLESQSMEAAARGVSPERMPALTRHVHHHVHSHHHLDEEGVNSGGEDGGDAQRFWAERVGSEGPYPSERTGVFESEVLSQSLIYPSERSQEAGGSAFRSLDTEGGQATARFSSEKKVQLAKSASLPRLANPPTLASPSEMRGSPSPPMRLDRYSRGVDRATATYANAGRVRGALR
jgi:hypothetical protein